MPFQKGKIKTGGKIKGSINKSTRDIKEAYRLLIENNLDNLTFWLELVAAKDPERAIKILSELSEYVIPKLARTDLTSGDEKLPNAININVVSPETATKVKKYFNG